MFYRTQLICVSLALLMSAGCLQGKFPSIPIGLLTDPNLARMSSEPRDRLRAELCWKFPRRKFQDPAEEKQFKQSIRGANEVGERLTRGLDEGKLSVDEYLCWVIYCEAMLRETYYMYIQEDG